MASLWRLRPFDDEDKNGAQTQENNPEQSQAKRN